MKRLNVMQRAQLTNCSDFLCYINMTPKSDPVICSLFYTRGSNIKHFYTQKIQTDKPHAIRGLFISVKEVLRSVNSSYIK